MKSGGAKGGSMEYSFNLIDRAEYKPLFDFLESKKLEIKNPPVEEEAGGKRGALEAAFLGEEVSFFSCFLLCFVIGHWLFIFVFIAIFCTFLACNFLNVIYLNKRHQHYRVEMMIQKRTTMTMKVRLNVIYSHISKAGSKPFR